MNKTDKNSLSYKIQKNPFLLGLFVVVLVLILVVVFSLSSALKDKTEELKASTTVATTEKVTSSLNTEPENDIDTSSFKKHVSSIKRISGEFDIDCIKLTVDYNNKKEMLESLFASNDFTVDVTPVFCFYINNGTEVMCPGKIQLVDDDTAIYTLSEIDDLANATALTDEITVNFENALAVLKFNLYLKHNTNDGVGRTLLGTYGKTHEQFNDTYAPTPVAVSEAVSGVKRVEMTETDEFVWLDVYFTDEKAYNSLNHNFENNFLCFGFEKGGKKYDWKFITTEYNDLYMIRCKIDSYALAQLNAEVEGDALTMQQLFDYRISVWTSDYDNEQNLFVIN